MGTFLVDSTGVPPGSYTSPALALAAIVAAGGTDHLMQPVRDGDTFTGTILDARTTTRLTIRPASGVSWTMNLDSIGTSLLPGVDTVIDGKHSTIIGIGTNYGARVDAGKTCTIRGVEMHVFEVGGGAGHVTRLAGAGAGLTMERVRVMPMGASATYLSLCRALAGAGNACTLTMRDVGIGAGNAASYGLCLHSSGNLAATITRCGRHVNSANPLFQSIAVGCSLTMQACCSPNLVAAAAALTAFVGGYNVYGTTVAGTTAAGDLVKSYLGMRLDGLDGLEPLPDSPLLTVIPSGLVVGAGDYDMRGNPRWRGGRLHVGPVQVQDPPEARARRRLWMGV